MVLESLLQIARQRTQCHAVNVTDELAFSWQRLLRNTVKNEEIIAGGIFAVYSVRTPHKNRC